MGTTSPQPRKPFRQNKEGYEEGRTGERTRREEGVRKLKYVKEIWKSVLKRVVRQEGEGCEFLLSPVNVWSGACALLQAGAVEAISFPVGGKKFL